MADTVCCIHDSTVSNGKVLLSMSVSKVGDISFSTTMEVDFLKSIVQLNTDIKTRVALILSTTFNSPSVANDVLLCGGFS